MIPESAFFDQLEARAVSLGGALCVGLDPHPGDVGSEAPEALVRFCQELMEATAPSAAAFKVNAAFFEATGEGGYAALRDVIRAAPRDIPVIVDAKRGDIGSTAEAYARAVFDYLGAGAVTVHPWLGLDSVEPFLTWPGRGVFALCRTSNPGAAMFQDQPSAAGLPLYRALARSMKGWASERSLGVVVGATAPDALRGVRAELPAHWILAPGVGAQGGSAVAAQRAGQRVDGSGVLLSASRSIARAASPGAAAAELLAQIRASREASAPAVSSETAALAIALVDSGCVSFGAFRLKSGLSSPIYIDLRRLVGHPALLARAAAAYAALLAPLHFHCLAALPYAALPIGTAVALQGGWRMVYPRREVKEYGTSAVVEGVFERGETAVMLDDLATTAQSKLEALDKLQAVGLEVRDVAVLIDRSSGAREALAARHLHLHAVFTLRELVPLWLVAGRITAQQAQQVIDFIETSSSV